METAYVAYCALNSLPREVYQHITEYLPPLAFERLAATSKRNDALANRPSYYGQRLSCKSRNLLNTSAADPFRLLYKILHKVDATHVWRITTFQLTMEAYHTDGVPRMLRAYPMSRRGWLRGMSGHYTVGQASEVRQRVFERVRTAAEARYTLVLMHRVEWLDDTYLPESREHIDAPTYQFYVTPTGIEEPLDEHEVTAEDVAWHRRVSALYYQTRQ